MLSVGAWHPWGKTPHMLDGARHVPAAAPRLRSRPDPMVWDKWHSPMRMLRPVLQGRPVEVIHPAPTS